MINLALVGDFNPEAIAHRAIPLALERARRETVGDFAWHWIHTRAIRDAAVELAAFHGVWLVPASPYENTAGALAAVRFARETRRPFLGTCGGFQHAVIEFARNVAGLVDADHAESNPAASMIVVSPLSCPLVEKSGNVFFSPIGLIRAAYRADSALEAYHCSYGLNAAYRARLEHAGLIFTGWDDAGEVRAVELPVEKHPFFVGTLFQPERAASRNLTPPLVTAFVQAIMQPSASGG